MKILVFDNYDSFTYNLVHLVEKILHNKVEVRRNDQVPLDEVSNYDRIILSPGPGIPVEAGLLLPLIKTYGSSKNILGVCLGHQAIGEAYGGKLINLDRVFHGVATPIHILKTQAETEPGPLQPASVPVPGYLNENETNLKTDEASALVEEGKSNTCDLFRGLPDEIEVGRYHSWIISEDQLPDELEVTAKDDNGFIMAIRHRHHQVTGVQFHPESVLTPMGEQIMRNWLFG